MSSEFSFSQEAGNRYISSLWFEPSGSQFEQQLRIKTCLYSLTVHFGKGWSHRSPESSVKVTADRQPLNREGDLNCWDPSIEINRERFLKHFECRGRDIKDNAWIMEKHDAFSFFQNPYIKMFNKLSSFMLLLAFSGWRFGQKDSKNFAKVHKYSENLKFFRIYVIFAAFLFD